MVKIIGRLADNGNTLQSKLNIKIHSVMLLCVCLLMSFPPHASKVMCLIFRQKYCKYRLFQATLWYIPSTLMSQRQWYSGFKTVKNRTKMLDKKTKNTMWVSSHLVSEQVLLQVLRRYLEIRGFLQPTNGGICCFLCPQQCKRDGLNCVQGGSLMAVWLHRLIISPIQSALPS